MGEDGFFSESTEQSVVKATIVSKYFSAWAKVVMSRTRSGRIAYIDIFAGPGRYKDGTKSTPVLILETAIANAEMRKMLVSLFNDADATHCRSLEKAIAEIPDVTMLKHKPVVHNYLVGTELAASFEAFRDVPALFFVDPWGYKGLSLGLINSVLRNWGSDCIFFFNYNRINMGLTNPAVREHLDALFGAERAEALRGQLEPLSPPERELVIIEALSQALKEMGGTYVLPFRFKSADGSRTSHHLIFVSKNVLGYMIMKEIMAAESTTADQGVPSFEYNAADVRFPLLFALTRPLDDLEDMLLVEFAGRTLTMEQVFEQHNVGKRYIRSNYQDALRSLEAKGSIKTDPPAKDRPKRKGEVTFAKHVRVTFRKERR